MKLLFVHDHYFQKHGENVYSDKIPYDVFSRYLEKFDEVHVWSRVVELSKKPKNISLASGEGVYFEHGGNISSLKSFFGYRKKIRVELEKEVNEVDAVTVRLPSEYGLMAANLAIKKNKPWSVEVVGCVWDALWNYGGIKSMIYAPVAYVRMKNIVRNACFSLYVTSDFLQERYPVKNEAVTTSVSNVEISTVDNKILRNRLYNIKEKNDRKIVIGTIGSLKTKYKGVHIGIKAISKLIDNKFDIEYRVLGSGDTKYYIKIADKLGLADNIYFDGSLPSGHLVFEWLDKLDIYIHPSFQEGLPRAVIEAMSRGCPVLASTTAGIPELVERNWLHKPGDYKKLANDLDRLMNDKSLMKKLATQNFKKSKNYSKSILDGRRAEYLDAFLQYVKTTK